MPGGGHRLEKPDEHAATLFAEVAVAVQLLDDGQVPMYSVDGLSEQVVVLSSLQWNVDVELGRELPRPQACSQDDHVAFDIARIRANTGDGRSLPGARRW